MAEFNMEEIRNAIYTIIAHHIDKWHLISPIQELAAISWLRYQRQYPRATPADWFRQSCPPSALRESTWVI